MALVVSEDWEDMENQDDLESLESSHINQGLLMSLLDETQVDDCDYDRLTEVMQSLEAEINPDRVHDESSGTEEYCSMPHDLDQHWMDVEFATSGEMENCWSLESSEQGIAGNHVLDQWTHDGFVSSVVIDHSSSFV
ncbi:hypothetical protein F511_08748 [Dorcoceras hygrometricum]|uniref:Uncharacterized protein n=1 Tax=Dorcoceras hygrometricum TaxID=472368 RepID=A0A2Z7ACF6_9LAMI|nr:hypothetical protein F511_08748 [Dorcoceras hygrometricum]